MFKFCQNNVLNFFKNKIKILLYCFFIYIFLLTGLVSATEVTVFEFTEEEFEVLRS